MRSSPPRGPSGIPIWRVARAFIQNNEVTLTVCPFAPSAAEPAVAPLPNEKLPRHVAIIMDGNGRWAESRGLSRSEGHRAGMKALKRVVQLCDTWGIEILTVFAFSTENWRRPKEEVSALMSLFVEYFEEEMDTLMKRGVRVRFMGNIDALPMLQRGMARSAVSKTANNAGPVFNIAINYGGRQELVMAAKSLAYKAAKGEISADDIDDKLFEESLFSAGLPDVDLLIRTSGEKRLSGFMPWQTAYAEIVFESELWPDFDENAFRRAISEFGARNRRFGGVASDEKTR